MTTNGPNSHGLTQSNSHLLGTSMTLDFNRNLVMLWFPHDVPKVTSAQGHLFIVSFLVGLFGYFLPFLSISQLHFLRKAIKINFKPHHQILKCLRIDLREKRKVPRQVLSETWLQMFTTSR